MAILTFENLSPTASFRTTHYGTKCGWATAAHPDSTTCRSSKRSRSPPQPAHRIYIGLQAVTGSFYTEAHAAFQREVKVWQIRNGGRTLKTRLQTIAGELESVVEFLIEQVHKKNKTTECPEIYCRPNKEIGPYKVEMEKKAHRDMLIDYLVGKRGSCLTGSLSKALEQLEAFRPYLTEKQFHTIDKVICHLKVVSDSFSSEDDSECDGLVEKINKKLLQTANDLLATALRDTVFIKKDKARAATESTISTTPNKKRHASYQDTLNKSSRQCNNMNQGNNITGNSCGIVATGFKETVATGSIAAVQNPRFPLCAPLTNLSPSAQPTTMVSLRQDKGDACAASVHMTATPTLPFSTLQGGSSTSLPATEDTKRFFFDLEEGEGQDYTRPITEDDISFFSDIVDEEGHDCTQSNNNVAG